MAKYALTLANLHRPVHQIAGGTAVLMVGGAVKSLVHDTEAASLIVTLATGERWSIPWSGTYGSLYASEKPAKAQG